MRLNSSTGQIALDTNQMLGSGGEAKVYPVKGDRRLVAKVYHQPTTERGEKLRAMLSHPPVDPGASQGRISIAWPVDVLTDAGGAVVGYLMPALRGTYPFSVVYHPGARRQSLPPGFDYRYLLRTAHNLSAAVAAIHDMGYVIGDLNDCNILVQPDATVTIIDCDSFQVGPYLCLVGRPEFTAPEVAGMNLSVTGRTVEQDRFALAVLVYQLLMSGYHPYAGVGEPGAIAERINAGLCPHASGGPKPPRGAPMLDWLPPSLQKMVRGAFVDGHNAPSTRPSAKDWSDQLLQVEKDLIGCRRNGSHAHFSHIPKCPACQAEAARKKVRKQAGGAAANATLRQRPMPGVRTRVPGFVWPRLTTPIVLLSVMLLAYNWSNLKRLPGQWDMDAVLPQGGGNGIAAYLTEPSVPQKNEPRKLESGSDIYRKLIGSSPYEPLARNLLVTEPGMSSGKTLGEYGKATKQDHPELETGSEIYRKYIGTDPY
ncbi:MAG: hypothetical protein AB2796_02515 [Candidatus Thiodiazotropha sp.]